MDATPDTVPARRWSLPFRSQPASIFVTALLSALGAVLVTWPLGREMGTATLRSGEVLLTAWQLNWYQHAFLTNPLAWVDANIFFPYDKAATFNDLLATHAVITLPAAWASSPVLALNLALLGGIVLCGVCGHLLIDELVDDPWAAVVGGTLFALAPFRFIHLGHLSIAAAWAIPLFFCALLRHLRQPSWRRAAAAAACGIAVCLSSLYHAAYVAPIAPLVLLVGARRGPGGLRTWAPLLAASIPALALLAVFLLPFAATLGGYGVASAPDDLLRYGADLSSLGRKLEDAAAAPAPGGIDPEAHLYPGAALLVLAAAGALVAAFELRALRGWTRGAAAAGLVIAGSTALGFMVPLSDPVRRLWHGGVLALIWVGPIVLTAWACAGARPSQRAAPFVAMRLGLAGAVTAFVLALGPQARYLTDVIGPAPYALLTRVSSAFAGTRVPARFGGLVILFLSLLAGGLLAWLAAHARKPLRAIGIAAASTALVVCFVELPLPPMPRGNVLVQLPRLRDPAYRWLSEHPGQFGVLELPDWPYDAPVTWRVREWRALRHMLASKQHGKHLVNGTGRIEPFLWQRFRGLEPWSDAFFTHVAAYFPIRYVLVHENGLPAESRDAVLARLTSGVDGWRQVFHSTRIRVYEIDRSRSRGTVVDRLFLRRDLTPQATATFSARTANGRPPGGYGSVTLELLRDGDVLQAWPIGPEWREIVVNLAVPSAPSSGSNDWPRTGVLLRWRVAGDTEAAIELRDIAVSRAP